MRSSFTISLLAPGLIFSLIRCSTPEPQPALPVISPEQAWELSRPAMHCIRKPYPYKPGNVLVDDSTVLPPRIRHPAFYGCFDWHSSVHGHWTLVKLLKEFPELSGGDTIREMFAENLSERNIEAETAFLYSEGNRTFERTYGWAWLLKLALELESWDDPLGRELASNLEPLADSLVRKYIEFLEILPHPIRAGEHTNTAFGLTFAWDYADFRGLAELKEMISAKSMEFYLDDRDCPVDWEPSGFDFLSPCLMEADLMSRVLDREEFRDWLKEFLPGMLRPGALDMKPAEVTDRSDPKIVHLDGLNFSRAWCLFHISEKLGGVPHLQKMAIEHLQASLPCIASGNYEGEHWLASFAVYALYSR